ncbi:Ribosomal lysine N-methyltransferase 4 [Malassezia sp. CBS 17886]|nr:Ribosomal lysine N-methyltransferase 4 [Malassezia sp. CBS 17886]
MTLANSESVQEEHAFLSWFQEHGGWIDPRCALQQVPGMGRGIVAAAPIAENERLFTIPRTMLMNLATSGLAGACRAAEMAEPPTDGASWAALSQRGWCPLILMMLREQWAAHTQPADAAMSWGPYFGIMPHSFDTPMFWDDAQVHALVGTDVYDKIGRADAETDYRECVLPYIRRYAHVFVGPLSDDAAQAALDQWYSIDMYHRMGSSILSRSFHVKRDLRHAEADDADITSAPAEVSITREPAEEREAEDAGAASPEGGAGDAESMHVDGADGAAAEGQENDNTDDGSSDDGDDDGDEGGDEEDVRDISMVPMADMLNARFGSENTRLFYKRTALEMRCTKPIAQGEQLLNTYGNPPNSDLLRRYGFVDEPNRGDLAVELPATRVVDAAAATLAAATGAPEAELHAKLSVRFEFACTELGVDEVFLLARLSKPTLERPYSTTLALDDSRRTLSSQDRRSLSRAAAAIPEELVAFARLLVVSDDAYAKAQRRGALPNARIDALEELDASWPRRGAAADGAPRKVAVASILCNAVAQRLSEYPTPWDETARQLCATSAPQGARERMALVVRAGDQSILTEHATVLTLLRRAAAAMEQAACDDARRTTTRDDARRTKKPRA